MRYSTYFTTNRGISRFANRWFTGVFRRSLFVLLMILTQAPINVWAQETKLPFTLSSWKYHSGDSLHWAHPGISENDWSIIDSPSFSPGTLPEEGWSGIGWFRIQIETDSVGVSRSPVLYMEMRGAAEIYLNGDKIGSLGKVGSHASDEVSVNLSTLNPAVIPVYLKQNEINYLSIRYSNFRSRDFYLIGGPVAGFGIELETADVISERIADRIRSFSISQILFTTVSVVFAFVFWVLFFFYREEKRYLYFSVLALSVAVLTFLDLQMEFMRDTDVFVFWRRVFMVVLVFASVTLLRFIYSLTYKSLPVQFGVVLVLSAFFAAWGFALPFRSFSYLLLFLIPVLLEDFRVTILAITKKVESTWIVGVGMLLFLAGFCYDLSIDMGWIEPIGTVTNGYYIGFTGLLACMAIFLSRTVAKTNVELKHRLEEVRELSEKTLMQELETARLEAENERAALELEKASELEASYRALEVAHAELKNTQGQLIHAEKMASLGKLTSGIAHEIKNPLNFVNNLADISADMAAELREVLSSSHTEPLPSAVSEILDSLRTNAIKIVEHGKRADRIVQNMMQHAQPAAQSKSIYDVNTLVTEYALGSLRSVTVEMSGTENINLVFDLDSNAGTWEVDNLEIGRVIYNLITNAVFALKERTGSDEAAIIVMTKRFGSSVRVGILDNADGIAPENLKNVFEPFFTTKSPGEGTGLGLSMSYDIITNGHKGRMWVDSILGEGSQFFFEVPDKPRA